MAGPNLTIELEMLILCNFEDLDLYLVICVDIEVRAECAYYFKSDVYSGILAYTSERNRNRSIGDAVILFHNTGTAKM